MLGDYLRRLFRGNAAAASTASAPGTFNRKVTPFIHTLTSIACTHPIRTITFVLVLASTSYVGVLESSLFDAQSIAVGDGVGHIDFDYLKDGARTLKLAQENGWKWQDNGIQPEDVDSSMANHRHLALVTLVFPNSLSRDSPYIAPSADHLLNLSRTPSVQTVPPTNPFSPISQDSSLAYTMAWKDADAFLQSVVEIPEKQELSGGKEEEEAERTWLARASKRSMIGAQGSLIRWISNAWGEFVDLLKHAETLDISIMFLGYLAMHLTLVSLFMSMRRMGSNFWLATTTLFSSVFAFCFGIVVTTKLGVPINMVLLSEGLPFLVVTVGFEKPIVLTKAVLSASLASRKNAQQHHGGGQGGSDDAGEPNAHSIQQSVQAAVREKGFDIVRDYAVEILILIAGAASGIQGGLRQFCFLAAWVLLFDMILLFTFYTAILCVKLEINRIKRYVALRRALEEDGVSRRVAENVASSADWPKQEDGSNPEKSGFLALLGGRGGDSSVPKFKILMFGGFILLNVINLATIPFRAEHKAKMAMVGGIQGVLTSPVIDPFKVADNGLTHVHNMVVRDGGDLTVTILPPIKYELSGAVPGDQSDAGLFDMEYADLIVGGRAIGTLLKSLEDPVLSKWIGILMCISLLLNGYLFNAARWSIKETPRPISNGAAVAPAKAASAPVRENGGAKPSAPPAAPVYVPKEGDRTKEECEKLLSSGQAAHLNDAELLDLACRGKIPIHALEKMLDNAQVMTKLDSLTRAVKIRRGLVSRTPATAANTAGLERSKLPWSGYNYENVHGACCENVVGYLPLPLGVAGPIVIDGESFFLPMATTEGVLVASTSRGCKAINAGGGVTTILTGDGMTRGPCVSFATLARAGAAKLWLDSLEGQKVMKEAFNSTSRFARLQTLKTAIAGSYLYIRFRTTTGDAMGMNMISKGCEKALAVMKETGFEDMTIISLSGNYCSDKKPAAINWIEGRGKSVVAEAIVPGDYVRKTLKTDVNSLIELNSAKNQIGSAMAGSIGGFNAHAANLVAAIYLATGQDPAQVVESSQCITVMKNFNGNLQISVSMPCLEVGTIGGGTVLEPQQAMLDMLGVKGAHPTSPGDNARRLARIIASAVLAGELSLCSALAAGHLVKAHMAHNRSNAPTRSQTPVSEAINAAPNLAQMNEVQGRSIVPAR